MPYSKFSVLMSVYHKDKPDDVLMSVESVTVKQSLKPDEVVLMIDGPIPMELKGMIMRLTSEISSLTAYFLEENGGLGNALNIGMTKVSNDLVARMDADDISLPDRFEKQIEFMRSNPDIAVCGGQISEFIDSPNNIVAYRKVPLSAEDCRLYFRNRDPLNHMTVMFRKDAVLSVGSYQPWHLDEDTYLWGRLLKKGYKLANLPDILVNVRVGSQMYARRGGWGYFKSDSRVLKWKLDNGLISKMRFIYNYIARFGVQVMIPNFLRAWVFKKLLRTK